MVAALHVQRNHWGVPRARGRRVVVLPPLMFFDLLTNPISKPVQALLVRLATSEEG